MEPEEKTKLIRVFESSCKSFYKLYLIKGKNMYMNGLVDGKYDMIKQICNDMCVLTEEQIIEMETHMKEQYK